MQNGFMRKDMKRFHQLNCKRMNVIKDKDGLSQGRSRARQLRRNQDVKRQGMQLKTKYVSRGKDGLREKQDVQQGVDRAAKKKYP